MRQVRNQSNFREHLEFVFDKSWRTGIMNNVIEKRKDVRFIERDELETILAFNNILIQDRLFLDRKCTI